MLMMGTAEFDPKQSLMRRTHASMRDFVEQQV